MTAPTQEGARSGARELARRAMTAQVAEMAIDLFVERGYEETTVDDICAVAGISRSSFFRYFRSKEDVLLQEVAGAANDLLSALQARPDDEAPWVAVRRALRPLVEQYGPESGQALRAARIARETPGLATFHQEKLARLGQLLRPEVARRIGSDPDDAADPRPTALIGAAFACLDAAVAAWAVADGKHDLSGLLDRAMDTIG